MARYREGINGTVIRWECCKTSFRVFIAWIRYVLARTCYRMKYLTKWLEGCRAVLAARSAATRGVRTLEVHCPDCQKSMTLVVTRPRAAGRAERERQGRTSLTELHFRLDK